MDVLEDKVYLLKVQSKTVQHLSMVTADLELIGI